MLVSGLPEKRVFPRYPDIVDIHDMNTFGQYLGSSSSMGDAEIVDNAIKSSDDTLTKLVKAIPMIQTAINNQKVFNAQLKIAKKQAEQTGTFDAPTVQNAAAYQARLNVGVDSSTQKMLMYGGIALLAVVLISSMKRG